MVLHVGIFESLGLFLVFGVEADGGWTVVDKADIHHCAKFARAYRLPECCAEIAAELLV